MLCERPGCLQPGTKCDDVDEYASPLTHREPGTVEARRLREAEDTTELRTEIGRLPIESRLRRLPHRDPGQAPMCRKSGWSVPARFARAHSGKEGGTAGYEQSPVP